MKCGLNLNQLNLKTISLSFKQNVTQNYELPLKLYHYILYWEIIYWAGENFCILKDFIQFTAVIFLDTRQKIPSCIPQDILICQKPVNWCPQSPWSISKWKVFSVSVQNSLRLENLLHPGYFQFPLKYNLYVISWFFPFLYIPSIRPSQTLYSRACIYAWDSKLWNSILWYSKYL